MAAGPSFWQRVYDRLFRVFGPAQLSRSDAPVTELTDAEVRRAAELEQWQKETDGTRTWLVRRPPG
jgi:hypothetical protein